MSVSFAIHQGVFQGITRSFFEASQRPGWRTPEGRGVLMRAYAKMYPRAKRLSFSEIKL